MSDANTWIVRRKKEDWDSLDYGDVMQAMTAADTPEEARLNGAALFDCRQDEVEAFKYNIGESAQHEPMPRPPSVHDE